MINNATHNSLLKRQDSPTPSSWYDMKCLQTPQVSWSSSLLVSVRIGNSNDMYHILSTAQKTTVGLRTDATTVQNSALNTERYFLCNIHLKDYIFVKPDLQPVDGGRGDGMTNLSKSYSPGPVTRQVVHTIPELKCDGSMWIIGWDVCRTSNAMEMAFQVTITSWTKSGRWSLTELSPVYNLHSSFELENWGWWTEVSADI